MNIIFDHGSAFLLAHGGFQVQIEQNKTGLEANHVHVEHLRWWDDSQKGDIIHFFGRPGAGYINFAHAKGIKVVITPLMTGMGSRTRGVLFFQKLVTIACRKTLPQMLTAPFGWDSFPLADACTASTAWEAYLMSYMFGAKAKNVHVLANGVEDDFWESPRVTRGQWLVCTATITERKRILELSQAAVLAKTPLWIIGKPYSDTDPYARQFLALVRQHHAIIRYEGPQSDRRKLAQAYRQSRGFVLLSTKESLSLSAGEAAACECPMLLSDLPWARTTFGDGATYCPITSVQRTAKALREFYDAAPGLKLPPKPPTWIEVGKNLKIIYEGLLNTSR